MSSSSLSQEELKSAGATLALQEVERLANELASLMRTGIPLHAGLRELAPSMSGRLPQFARRLAARLESGVDLAGALREERERLPGFFLAVVDAGIRSGDPGIALKSIADTARRVDELRRVEFHSLVYPLLIGFVALGLGCFSLYYLLPPLWEMYMELETAPWLLVQAKVISDSLAIWGPMAAVLLVAGWCWTWMRPIPWRAIRGNRNWFGVGKLPTRRNLMTSARWATMLEVLQLLLNRQVPLHESLQLAAAVALPSSAQSAIDSLAQKAKSGEMLRAEDYVAAGFPRAIAIGLATPRRSTALLQTLGQLEHEYRWIDEQLRRRFLGPWINLITVGLAALFVLLYLAAVIGPAAQVFYDVVNNRIY
jgi:type II secretory pathway component PulF